MSELMTAQQLEWLEARGLNETTWHVLTNSIFVGAQPQSIMMAVEYCKARGLDIMKKPCHIVPMWVKDARTKKGGMRDIIMPSITEQRITAARTGEYAGQDAAVFGEMVTIKFNKTNHVVPDFCTVTVYRIVQGKKVPFTHTEYFEEACATTKDGDLNTMWTKRKRGQLAKCAEAGALRKAFPEEIGNEYTVEEMQGKTININGVEESDVQLLDESYKSFYKEQHPKLVEAANKGMSALMDAHKLLKTLDDKEHIKRLWAESSPSLKELAQKADIKTNNAPIIEDAEVIEDEHTTTA